MEKGSKLISDLKAKEKAYVTYDISSETFVYDDRCFSKREDLEKDMEILLADVDCSEDVFQILEITAVKQVKIQKTAKIINA